MSKMILVVGFLLLIISIPALAVNTCSGTISGVSMAGDGDVFATIKNNSDVNLSDVLFCSLKENLGKYTMEACKGVLSILLTGQALNKTATLWFNSSDFDGCNHRWGVLHNYGFYHFKLN